MPLHAATVASPWKRFAKPASSLPDVTHLLKDLYHALDPDTRDRIGLVGGQALWVWGTYYLLDEMTGEERASLASHDIDFLGRTPEIDRCAEAWHQHPERPSPFEPTPHTAIFLLDHDLEDRPLFDCVFWRR